MSKNASSNIFGFGSSNKQKNSLETDTIMATFYAVSAKMMIIDDDLNIIAANNSVKEFLLTVESDIRKELPNFSVKNLVGTNIDTFHKKPEHQRKMIPALQQPYETTINLAGHVFALRATPLISGSGVRIGTAMEWFDSQMMDNAGQVAGLNKSQAVIHFQMDGTISSASWDIH